MARSCSLFARAASVSRRSSVHSVFMSSSHPAVEQHESAFALRARRDVLSRPVTKACLPFTV